ncbi:uncharacterized protein LOC128604446 [Ictalurus furcatus]|uniref:uncharacterized protein LOC128604446 n=1 Tax=Ictalurus furcatus TaxID=66913 RepID=UPI00234FC823|nr:uncharacterized protein LOC128604446 [Ictalurus furcatus]
MNYHSYSNQLCDAIIEVEELFTRWSSPGQFMYTVPGVTPNIMKSIIQYGYSQRIRITRKNVKALLEAADYLLMDDIVHTCCRFLEKLRDRASLMVEQSLMYRLGVPESGANSQLRSNSPGVGDSSGRRRQTPYTRRHTSSNGAWNVHPTQITHTLFFLFLLIAIINTSELLNIYSILWAVVTWRLRLRATDRKVGGSRPSTAKLPLLGP